MEQVKRRSEVRKEDQWDLSLIYKSEKDFENDLALAKEEIKKITDYKDFLTNAKRFLEYIKYDEKVDRLLNKLYYYAHLNHDSDTTDTKYQKMVKQVTDLMSEYSELSSFVVPKLMGMNYEVIESFYKKEPELKEYEFELKDLYRFQKHTLEERDEKILSTLSTPLSNASNTYEALTDSDMEYGLIKDENGNDVEMTDSNYSVFLSSKDRRVRKDAFHLMYDTYAKFKNTITSTYLGDMDANIALAKLRNYKSAREGSLFQDHVTTDIYDNLVDTVNDHLDVFHKYYSLKKEILGLPELHLYDIYVDLIETKDFSHYTFEEAKSLVLEALSVLGEDYVSNLKKAFQERWIDIYHNKGKRSGAYSSGFYDTKPYVLLNFEGKIDDVSTLAHELGHSMHTYYSCKNNPYQYSQYQIFVAEVASTVNELILSKYLLNKVSDIDSKLYILNRMMELFKGTIFRQTMFAEFERDMYQKREAKEVLTNDVLSDAYYNLNKKYFGGSVVTDEEIKYEWERIPHFYYGFYVYKYATGLSSACHIVEGILSHKEGALENYLAFLKTGGSMYPVEELKVAGVDITKKEVVESAIHMFEDVLNEFQTLYNEKIKSKVLKK